MRRRPCRGNKRRPLSFVSIFGAAVEGGSDCNFGAGQGGAGPGGGECDGRAPERKKPAAGAAAPGAVRRFVRGAPNVTRLRPRQTPSTPPPHLPPPPPPPPPLAIPHRSARLGSRLGHTTPLTFGAGQGGAIFTGEGDAGGGASDLKRPAVCAAAPGAPRPDFRRATHMLRDPWSHRTFLNFRLDHHVWSRDS
jgi:hypothetical protein